MDNTHEESAVLKMIGPYLELVLVLLRKIHPLRLTPSQIDALMKKEHAFWPAFEKCLDTLRIMPIQEKARELAQLEDLTCQIQGWKDFYQKFFGIALDMGGVRIPRRIPGFDRLIVVAKGVSINQVYEKGKGNFSSWKWCDGDIEGVMQETERETVKETYAIWVRDEREADTDLLGKSALDVERPEDTESPLERLLHGFKYWSETGEHLDVKTYTLCASSRYSDGGVPFVTRGVDGDVGVHVGRCDPQDRYCYIGARRAVR